MTRLGCVGLVVVARWAGAGLFVRVRARALCCFSLFDPSAAAEVATTVTVAPIEAT